MRAASGFGHAPDSKRFMCTVNTLGSAWMDICLTVSWRMRHESHVTFSSPRSASAEINASRHWPRLVHSRSRGKLRSKKGSYEADTEPHALHSSRDLSTPPRLACTTQEQASAPFLLACDGLTTWSRSTPDRSVDAVDVCECSLFTRKLKNSWASCCKYPASSSELSHSVCNKWSGEMGTEGAAPHHISATRYSSSHPKHAGILSSSPPAHAPPLPFPPPGSGLPGTAGGSTAHGRAHSRLYSAALPLSVCCPHRRR
jgi:hypothetical protein